MQNSTVLQNPSGITPTSSGIKSAIIDMTKAMRADYGTRFVNAFPTDEALNNYKNRLLTSLKGMVNAVDLCNGYEACIEDSANHDFIPSIPKIVSYANAARDKRLMAEKNVSESQHVTALPPPKRDFNPLDLLAKLRLDLQSSGGEQKDSRPAHKALIELGLASGSIRIVKPEVHHKCAHGNCFNAGALSNGTRGNGNWYCSQHFRAL